MIVWSLEYGITRRRRVHMSDFRYTIRAARYKSDSQITESPCGYPVPGEARTDCSMVQQGQTVGHVQRSNAQRVECRLTMVLDTLMVLVVPGKSKVHLEKAYYRRVQKTSIVVEVAINLVFAVVAVEYSSIASRSHLA